VCDAYAKVVILLMSLVAAFKVQKWIDGNDFASWKHYSVVLTFRAGVSMLLRE